MSTIADLFTSEAVQYEGDLARFYCMSHHTPYLRIEWLLNGSLARNTNYKFQVTEESHESTSVLIISALPSYSGLHIQCEVHQKLGYKSVTDPKVFWVQGGK